MKKKLTLSVEEEVIENFRKTCDRSISDYVETMMRYYYNLNRRWNEYCL